MRKEFNFPTALRVALLAITVLFGTAGLAELAYTQQNQNTAEAQLSILPVRGNVYLLSGAGGNITVSVGRDGVLLVDAGSEQMSDAVVAAVKQLANAVVSGSIPAATCVGLTCIGLASHYGWNSTQFNGTTVSRTPAKPIRYIINTSMDPEHTGGNLKARLAGTTYTGGNVTGAIEDSGTGAAILAHENTLNWMTAAELPADALPTDTYRFSSYKLTQFFNGEGVQMFHAAARTDGDTMVWFRYSDVLATGDVYSAASYPVIELDKGGSIQGVLDGLNRILEVAYAEFRSQGGTMIIPGHGRLSDVGDVANYRNMVSIIIDRVQDLINQGKTLQQVKAARPTMDYDGRWGSTTGPWTTDMFIEAVYRSLTEKKR